MTYRFLWIHNMNFIKYYSLHIFYFMYSIFGFSFNTNLKTPLECMYINLVIPWKQICKSLINLISLFSKTNQRIKYLLFFHYVLLNQTMFNYWYNHLQTNGTEVIVTLLKIAKIYQKWKIFSLVLMHISLHIKQYTQNWKLILSTPSRTILLNVPAIIPKSDYSVCEFKQRRAEKKKNEWRKREKAETPVMLQEPRN